jgi:hypothetical protein
MDPRIARLKTYDDCNSFAENVSVMHPELAAQAKMRGVLLRADAQGAKSEVERDAFAVVFALEDANTIPGGRRYRATRTRNAFNKVGIIRTVEKKVSQKSPPAGFEALIQHGLDEFTFEAVVLRHPDFFSTEAVNSARLRLEEFEKIKRQKGMDSCT